jgi:hypothetical protein
MICDIDRSTLLPKVFFMDHAMKNQKSTSTKDLSSEDRYDRDPQFKALVDILGALIRQARFTPTELKEAVKLAELRCRKIVKVHTRKQSMI